MKVKNERNSTHSVALLVVTAAAAAGAGGHLNKAYLGRRRGRIGLGFG
jgi:hypothetical protein